MPAHTIFILSVLCCNFLQFKPSLPRRYANVPIIPFLSIYTLPDVMIEVKRGLWPVPCAIRTEKAVYLLRNCSQ